MRLHLAIALALAGCAPAAPEEPTWIDDVRPILAANCIRCHGDPARNLAPPTFRLDVLEDVGGVKGARSMAEFVAARAATLGDMPAEGPSLASWEKETLLQWQYTTAAGRRENNHIPEVTFTAEATTGDQATIHMLITDADRDLVSGELKSDGATVASLRTGAQEIELDTSGLPAGERAITAILDDGTGPMSVNLGTLVVSHANTTPNLTLLAPRRDDLVVAGNQGTSLFRATDPDPGADVSVDLKAITDQTEMTIAGGVKPEPSGLGEHGFDTTGWAEGEWRIEATVTDGTASRTVRSEPFIVSHPTGSERYADVRPIIDNVCARCHSAHLPTGPNFRLLPKLQESSGRAWRRVSERKDMPPPSMRAVLPDIVFTDEDRRRLSDWFYAGAPE